MNRTWNDKGNLLMMSVVLIVVGGLAFTVVMQAVAYDVLAVRANRAELAAANALTSGVNIVTSDIRRYGPSHYPANPLVIHRDPGDPYCDEGCWTVGVSNPLIDRGVDLRGAGQVSTLAVREATIYAASECQAEPSASPPDLLPERTVCVSFLLGALSATVTVPRNNTPRCQRANRLRPRKGLTPCV